MKNFFSRMFRSVVEWVRPSHRIQKEQPISPEQFQKMLAQTLADPEFKLLLLKSMAGTVWPIRGGVNHTNYIPKFDSGGSPVDTVAPVYEDSSGKVGIGTTSPLELLHVKDPTGTAPARIAIQSGNGREWTLVSGNAAASSRFDIRDASIGAERLSIDSNGNVGIGTTSPLYTLDVKAATDKHLAVRTGSGFGTDAGGIYLQSVNDANNLNKPFSIESSVLTLNAATGGNVGIGTTSPQAKLDVGGIFQIDTTTGKQHVTPTHAVAASGSWAAVNVNPTLTNSSEQQEEIVGVYTAMTAPTGKKTFMYGYDVDLFPGGEQTDADGNKYDVNGYVVNNGGLYRAESALDVGGGESITNGGDNSSLYAWVQAIELSISAEVGIWFGPGTGTATVNAGHPPFDVGIDMFLSSFNTCAIRLPNGAGNGIRGRNAANSADYRLIDIDGSNNVVVGAASAVLQGAPPSAPADGDLNNSNISFYLDEGGNNLMVKVKYSDGTVKTGTVSLS